MNGKQPSPKRLLLIIISIIAGMTGIAGYLLPEKAESSDRMYFQNAAGAVVFGHKAHADLVGSCASCHHDLIRATDRASCDNCHEEHFKAADYTHDIFTAVEAHECSFCHTIANDAQAQPCGQCHPKSQEAETSTTACNSCHADSYTPDLMGHSMLTEIHSDECGNCHNPSSKQVAYHNQCNACHLEQKPDLFRLTDGSTQCERCHLK